MTDAPAIILEDLAKAFTLHNQSGARIPVFSRLNLSVSPGECVALVGPSGVGKSTLMRAIYANYRASAGAVRIRHDGALVDLSEADPHVVLDIRRRTLGYVSQFLRVIPRVPTLSLVSEPLLQTGVSEEEARDRARTLLARLNLPDAHCDLPPATFSGGEQQRVNIARTLIHPFPVLLLDEPTAALDPENRAIVVELIQAARDGGAAVIGIFHDADVRNAVATRNFAVADYADAA